MNDEKAPAPPGANDVAYWPLADTRLLSKPMFAFLGKADLQGCPELSGTLGVD